MRNKTQTVGKMFKMYCRFARNINGLKQVNVRQKWPCLIQFGGRFNIKMPSYQYKKIHCGDKTILRSPYLHNGISDAGKITPLYWIRPWSRYQMSWLRDIAYFPVKAEARSDQTALTQTPCWPHEPRQKSVYITTCNIMGLHSCLCPQFTQWWDWWSQLRYGRRRSGRIRTARFVQ